MTDLERARSILRSIEAAVHPAMRDTLVKCIAHELGVVRREGAEEALEEAARVADGYCTDRTDDVAAAIRAPKDKA